MSDIPLFILLVFIFLSIPVLIFAIGATVVFGGAHLYQFLLTGKMVDLYSAGALILASFFMYLVFRKVRRWIREEQI